jgi:DNA-binding NarL/FixJ family response regulator
VTDQISVLLVDDEALMRDGLRAILESEPDLNVVGEAADGAGAVAETRRHRPDVVLMDLRMPGRDGIWATQAIVAAGLPSRVVVLTTFDQDDNVLEALRAGACGYLLKSTSADRLIASVRNAAAGETSLSPSVLDTLVSRAISRDGRRRSASRVLDRLTSRELEVLRLMARGATNDDIAQQLVIAEATVKSHVSRVLAKLEVRDRVQAVILAYEGGVVRVGA